MRFPWTWLKSSGGDDEVVQGGQVGVATPPDEDTNDERFDSDWEDSRQLRLTEDQIWKSRPKHIFKAVTTVPFDDHGKIMDKYGTLQAFADELCSTADFDTLADLIERGGIDAPILRVPDESISQLAKEDVNGNNAFRRACCRMQFVAGKVYLDALSKQKPDTINDTIKDSINEGTLLHFAAMTYSSEIVGFLLREHACVGKEDKNGMTAWDLAVAQRDGLAIGQFASHHVSTGLKKHWYRKRLTRGGYEFLGNMSRVLVKHTVLQDETEVLRQGLRRDFDTLLTVAANKRIWIMALLNLLCDDTSLDPDKRSIYMSFVQTSFKERGIGCTNLVSREPRVVYHEDVLIVRDQPKPRKYVDMMSLVMPYFYHGTLRTLRKRQTIYSSDAKSPNARDRERAAQGLHLPLTLDEYCNPNYDEVTLSMRNQDQVLARFLKSDRLDVEDKRKQIQPRDRLLMVHQGWMYRFEDQFIFAFPEIVLQEPAIRKALLELEPVMSIGDEPRYLYYVAQCLSAFIGLPESPSGLPKPSLDIFEESISSVSIGVERYFYKKPSEQEKAADDEKRYFHDIADIRDELAMMRSVVEEQENVWTEVKTRLLALFEVQSSLTTKDVDYPRMTKEELQGHEQMKAGNIIRCKETIKNISLQLQRIKNRIDRIDQNAERVQNLIPQYLELKRSYTSMKESHYTALLGGAVFGLSVVTIIFTPMSFILALLAVPNESLLLESLEKQGNDTGVEGRRSNFVRRWTGVTEGVSMAVTIILMGLAWYLFVYKAGFQGGQATEYERLDVSKRSGDAQATEDLGTVGLTTSKINGTELRSTGGQLRERPSPKSWLARLQEKLSDLEQGRGHLNSAEGD